MKYKNEPNLKIVWFEEMKKDLIAVIREMSSFLGYHLTEPKVNYVIIPDENTCYQHLLSDQRTHLCHGKVR